MTTRRLRKTKVTVRMPWRANGPSADKKALRRVKAANGLLWPSRQLELASLDARGQEPQCS